MAMSIAVQRTSGACRLLIAALALPVLVAWLASPGWAETPAAACERLGTDDTLRPIPESLVPAVNAASGTEMPVGVALRTTVFRCADGRVLVCAVGANLPCGRASTSRTPGAGAIAWCSQNRDAAFIPAVATGHDTIYAWQCHDGAPLIARQVLDVDKRGFIVQFWKELP
jgi:hypothetical protein